MYTPHLEVEIGCMFSGKSTELIRKINRYQIARRRCIVLKWNKDEREKEENNTLITHDGTKIHCIRVSNKLMESIDKIKNYDVIGIDDGQFFPDIVNFCETIVNTHNKIVIVAALDSNYKREPFVEICNLISKAEKVKKLRAICTKCGSEASFSRKKENKNEEEEEENNIIDIGGTEKYEALCRNCYMECQ